MRKGFLVVFFFWGGGVISDEAIQKHVLAADWFINSLRVCAYVSCAKLQEVETSKIMACLLQRQHEFPGVSE
jgi:5-formyltetrahydrofolate cyclo-ligase